MTPKINKFGQIINFLSIMKKQSLFYKDRSINVRMFKIRDHKHSMKMLNITKKCVQILKIELLISNNIQHLIRSFKQFILSFYYFTLSLNSKRQNLNLFKTRVRLKYRFIHLIEL